MAGLGPATHGFRGRQTWATGLGPATHGFRGRKTWVTGLAGDDTTPDLRDGLRRS
jgi:hypothetical protein